MLEDGVIGAWPICLGYLPIGLAFGVIAQKAGLSPVEIGLMSLLVYAGSSQFIAVSMLSAGNGIAPIVIAVFTVNLRHMLMSSYLATFMRNIGIKRLSLFAYGVTDESFALNSAKFRPGNWDWRRALVLNHVTNLSWIASTTAGGFSGQFIPEGVFGIDFALGAMFICLLIFQLQGMLYVAVAIIAGVLAVALSLILPGNSYIVAASVVAAALGVVFKRMGLVTYVPRWLPLVFLSRITLPKWFEQWLDLIPAAILSALILPMLITSGEPRRLDLMRPELFAALPTFLFAVKTRLLAGTLLPACRFTGGWGSCCRDQQLPAMLMKEQLRRVSVNPSSVSSIFCRSTP